jgi:hypothetical protein
MATHDEQTGGTFAPATDSLTTLHWLGIALAIATGVIHLYLGVAFAPSGLGISFLAAGVVFLAGAGGVLVDYQRSRLYLLGIPFTLGQIVIWYAINAPDFGTLGIADKVVQVAFVAVLVALYRRD